ncbi:hypothetical protein [Methanocalculus sp.]|uniref:hypothetical protein n=1 Tax=Methanocalculus sp. TaxID=2004547 RepID=UPI002638C79F|nr:hypothetical protein [Methanocalculus sp.]MDG6250332.1 hypothetical protein [Methanocalculus sp.]
MTDESPPVPPPDGESPYTRDDLSDINTLAVKEFIRLIQSDQSLAPEWKEEMLRMLDLGVPDDISSLEKMIEEAVDAATQEAERKKLPRDS